MDNDKEVVERLVDENLSWKLDSYLQKFNKANMEWELQLKLEKTVVEKLFKWVLQVNIDWKIYRYEREDYKNLWDLINHLFEHFKEELSKK